MQTKPRRRVAPTPAGKAGAELVRRLVTMVEQWAHARGLSHLGVDRRAKFSRQYFDKLRAGIAKNPDFRIDMVTASRLADVVGHRLMLIPDDMAADVEALLARRPEPLGPDASTADLRLTMRSWHALHKADILTIGDLTKKTRTDLLALPGFGPGCLKEVETMLAAHGLALKGGGK
jgi:hypothetical protein